jgi:hypothetical protein
MSKKLTGKAKQKARAKAFKAKEALKKPNVDLSGKTHRLPVINGFLSFTMDVELKKMISKVTEDIIPHNTIGTQVDIDAMDYGINAGFFIALIPRKGNGLMTIGTDATKVHKVLADFTMQPFNQDWLVLSTYCSKDRVLGHMNDINDTLHYAFIGYSTPDRLSTIAEDRDLCIALRDKTDPWSKKKLVA